MAEKGEIMTREQHISCENIIRKASAASGTMSIVPSPSMSGIGIQVMLIQISMAIALGKVFGLSLTQSAAGGLCRSIIGLTAEFSPYPGKNSTWNNIKDAVHLTETIGWKLAEKFANT